jgi:hypothetical protein
MSYPIVLSVLFSLLFLILPATAAPGRRTEAMRDRLATKCRIQLNVSPKDDLVIPSNIQVPDILKNIVNMMLMKSPTFRAQCRVLANSPKIRIKLTLLSPGYYPYRAVSNATHFRDGTIMIEMRFIPPSDYIEMIGHEFEHAVEQAEGLNIRALAASGRTQVYEVCGGDGFESRRAINAGRTVAREYYGKQEKFRAFVAAKGAPKEPANRKPLCPRLINEGMHTRCVPKLGQIEK